MIQKYNQKLVISGHIIEYYSYKEPVFVGYKNENLSNKKSGRSSQATVPEKILNRMKVMDRARRDLRRIINCNIHSYGFDSKFLTLTFAENVVDLKMANYEFKKFIQRLGYKLGFKAKYSVVVEFQKRGAIHYHVVLYNVPYIANNELRVIWGHGHVKINKISNVDNVGAYVTKYMTKGLDERLEGEKSYFNSRGLKKPKEYKNENEIKSVGSTLNLDIIKPCYESSFQNEHNSITYRQYNLKRGDNQGMDKA